MNTEFQLIGNLSLLRYSVFLCVLICTFPNVRFLCFYRYRYGCCLELCLGLKDYYIIYDLFINIDFIVFCKTILLMFSSSGKSTFLHNTTSLCSTKATLNPARKLIIRSYYCGEPNDHSFEIRVDSSKEREVATREAIECQVRERRKKKALTVCTIYNK